MHAEQVEVTGDERSEFGKSRIAGDQHLTAESAEYAERELGSFGTDGIAG